MINWYRRNEATLENNISEEACILKVIYSVIFVSCRHFIFLHDDPLRCSKVFKDLVGQLTASVW